MLSKLRRWGMVPMLPAMIFMMPPSKAPVPAELPADIQAQLIKDVRCKLHQHYQTDAKTDKRFDFRSFKHATLEDGLVQVHGDFLLSATTAITHMGRVELFYAANDSGWSMQKHYRVEEKAITLHELVIQVKDGLSGKPLADATVVARSGLRRSNAERTDAQGGAQLDLLQGTFQVFATHPLYHSSITPHVEVRAAQQAKDIFLLPKTQP